MMLLRQSQSNTVHLTLSEKNTLVYPYYYLVGLKNDETGVEAFCIAGQAYSTPRVDGIVIQLGVNDPTHGKIILSQTGFYNYRVFAQYSNANLDPANANVLVEVGKCKVLPASYTAPTAYNGQDKSIVVYNG